MTLDEIAVVAAVTGTPLETALEIYRAYLLRADRSLSSNPLGVLS